MNLQTLLYPLAEITETSFDILLVPMSNLVNWACIALAFVGIFMWMSLQAKYNKQAAREGTLK